MDLHNFKKSYYIYASIDFPNFFKENLQNNVLWSLLITRLL